MGVGVDGIFVGDFVGEVGGIFMGDVVGDLVGENLEVVGVGDVVGFLEGVPGG